MKRMKKQWIRAASVHLQVHDGNEQPVQTTETTAISTGIKRKKEATDFICLSWTGLAHNTLRTDEHVLTVSLPTI